MIGRLSPTTTWHLWLAWTAGSFAYLEAKALRAEGESATLTAHLRKVLGVHPRRRMCPLGQAIIAGVLTWLSLHLCLGVFPSDGWTERRR